MGLAKYRAKRHFARTPEPSGQKQVRKRPARPAVQAAKSSGRSAASRPTASAVPAHPLPHFVIQKHAARRLHYDFRLEMEGVLKSWAVPKNIPTHRGEKRLAVQVEDHPLEYGSFEGVIPPGNYGAGAVMVWDQGTYVVAGKEPTAALREGKLPLVLTGNKLNGEWTLLRLRRPTSGDNAWLLIKTGETVRPISARAEDSSAKTGRTMKRIAQEGAVWISNRTSNGKPTPSRHTSPSAKAPAAGLSELPAKTPEFIEPMKALLQASLPNDDHWLLEVKLDGIRAIGVKTNDQVKLFSRRPRDITGDYPEIAAALRELPVEDLVVDGEIVALDDQGRSSFQLLQNLKRKHANRASLQYHIFDLLNVKGRDLTGQPLAQRKAALEVLLEAAEKPLRFCASLTGNFSKVWERIRRLGLEGVIAKRDNSLYEPGRRSGAWVKVKAQNQQEFVIGGYTPPQGSRSFFGAILVGYYAGSKLLFASGVGTGFNQASLRSLHQLFQKHRTPHCPFANLPAPRGSGAGQSISASEMRRMTWLTPTLVAEIKFLEWTRDGNLRQPVFLGLREDKKPETVVREQPQNR